MPTYEKIEQAVANLVARIVGTLTWRGRSLARIGEDYLNKRRLLRDRRCCGAAGVEPKKPTIARRSSSPRYVPPGSVIIAIRRRSRAVTSVVTRGTRSPARSCTHARTHACVGGSQRACVWLAWVFSGVHLRSAARRYTAARITRLLAGALRGQGRWPATHDDDQWRALDAPLRHHLLGDARKRTRAGDQDRWVVAQSCFCEGP